MLAFTKCHDLTYKQQHLQRIFFVFQVERLRVTTQVRFNACDLISHHSSWTLGIAMDHKTGFVPFLLHNIAQLLTCLFQDQSLLFHAQNFLAALPQMQHTSEFFLFFPP